jgi:hypothetical protein
VGYRLTQLVVTNVHYAVGGRTDLSVLCAITVEEPSLFYCYSRRPPPPVVDMDPQVEDEDDEDSDEVEELGATHLWAKMKEHDKKAAARKKKEALKQVETDDSSGDDTVRRWDRVGWRPRKGTKKAVLNAEAKLQHKFRIALHGWSMLNFDAAQITPFGAPFLCFFVEQSGGLLLFFKYGAIVFNKTQKDSSFILWARGT